jgi:hypothetical protein
MLLFLSLSVSFAADSYDAEALLARLGDLEQYRSSLLSETTPNVPDEAYRKAAEGSWVTGLKEVPGESAQIGWGIGIYDIPIERLWAGVNDEMNHTGMTPVDFTEIVKGKVCEDKRHILMALPIPVISDRWWIVRNSLNPGLVKTTGGAMRELSWTEVSDPWNHPKSAAAKERVEDQVAVPFTRGAWLLMALDDGHTFVEYHAWSDPGGYIPAGPASTFASGSIDQTLQAMEDYGKKSGSIQCEAVYSK